MVNIVEPNASYIIKAIDKKYEKIIDNLLTQGKLPIIVGGTGLYIKSLINPYSFCNVAGNNDVREKYKQVLANNGKEYLYKLLEEKDPNSCKKIHINDTKRVIRALEICEISGQEKTKLNENDFKRDKQEQKYTCIFIVLDLPREELYNRINLRVEKMFDAGLVTEIKRLLDNDIVNKNSQSMQAIGYKEFFRYFNGEININELKELIAKNSRNYAKRQLTFFRSFKEAKWFNPLTEYENIIEYIKKELKNVSVR